MRVLGIGDHADLGALYQRLLAEGHEVRIFVADPASHDVMAGLLERVDAWEPWLGWAGRDGLVVFEGTGWGDTQDRLRAEGYCVVGGGSLGDRLELDRHFGQEALREAGLPVARSHAFDGPRAFADAGDFIARQGGRWVLKYSGSGLSSTRTYVGQRADGADVRAVLDQQRRTWPDSQAPALVLMEHVLGVEVGVGAFFDGRAFLRPANLDWEHKRFFPGDLGELTGEMGTVATFRGADRLFDATLARLAPRLAASGYRGYVNLNTIVDERGPWPLELTCRFGYPGFAVLGALLAEPWGTLLRRVGSGDGQGGVDTHDGFDVGVVLTVPPFPYPDAYAARGKGATILLDEAFTAADHDHLWYGEMARTEGVLQTAGQIGYAMVVTGRGPTIVAAQRDAYDRVAGVVIPNVRYRNDIGDRLVRQDLACLQRWGWLP
jgi:phosphoribosylamine--glycine ligase